MDKFLLYLLYYLIDGFFVYQLLYITFRTHDDDEGVFGAIVLYYRKPFFLYGKEWL